MSSAAGYRTGLYTSPHLEDVSERIRIDGRVIPAASLYQYLVEVVEVAERELGHLPTYFEALTAVAFRYFAEEGVELAVLEVGLGGRLDATNTVSPVLSLLTEIGLEHRDHLGETVQSIAQEKAGILRPGRPAVAWVQRREARSAIERAAMERGAELRMGPELAEIRSIEELGRRGQRVRLQTAAADYCSEVSLLGKHQAANFALAVLGAETLAADRWSRLDRQAIERGASVYRWPGRLERVELSSRPAVLLDAAHNADGVESWLQFLEDKGLSFDLLFGTMADKEVEQILPAMVQRAEQVTLTAPTSDRAMSPERLAELVTQKQPRVELQPELALRRALDTEQELLVTCGSVYLVGEVRGLLRREFGVPEPATSSTLADYQSES